MEGRPVPSAIRRIAFIGNYMPRQCGIATFTTDLCEAIAARISRHDLHRPARQRHRGRLRLSGPRSVRADREGHRVVPARRRFPEHQQRRPGVPAVRIRHLRRTGGQPHPGPLAGIAHARRHDPAHHPQRARSRSAPGAGRGRRAVGSPGRHERTRRGIPAGRSITCRRRRST
ncbi:MAG: hypothetical protein M0C28_47180 [Candidatus Moduliflexus flocculans]|nr:hypothetical protein [Candidatus Moduliflexus flocculans]